MFTDEEASTPTALRCDPEYIYHNFHPHARETNQKLPTRGDFHITESVGKREKVIVGETIPGVRRTK